MLNICSDDIITMISYSMLHLRTTSLHDMITMLACVASPMCSFYAVDDNHCHASNRIAIACYHMSPYVASLMLDDLPCIECNNTFSLANEIAPVAFSHIFGACDIFHVKHVCLPSLHHINSAMKMKIVDQIIHALLLLMVMCKKREPS